jgi:hypothetical protein
MTEARTNDPEFDHVRSWRLPDIKARIEGETFTEFLTQCGLNADRIHNVRRMFTKTLGAIQMSPTPTKRCTISKRTRGTTTNSSAGTMS